MIRRVYCDRRSFREVTLSEGFNIILADRTNESTKKDTRNGLGKSTFIEVIHFCLGGRASRHGLGAEALKGWTFSLDVELAGHRLSVSRDTATPGKVILDGDIESLPVQPRLNVKTKRFELKISEWRESLGALMFDLPVQAVREAYSPTFRGLISFFSRRGRDAYSVPFENHRKQTEVDTQVYNSFLLGLDWDYAREWQILKDRKNVLEKLKSASESGDVKALIGSLGELEAVRVRIRSELESRKAQLTSFKVHPQYRDIEDSANELTRTIHELSNRTLADSRLLEFYRASVENEQTPAWISVEEMYSEVGITFPDAVRRRLSDVRTFHESVIRNRKGFLGREMDRLEHSIAANRKTVAEKTRERAKLLDVLQTHGALQEYNKLQERSTELAAQLADIERRIKSLRDFEEGKSALAIDQEVLQQRARQDLEDRREITERAIAFFNGNSESLYEAPGNLIIDLQRTGYKFSVEIERSGSQGIDSMKVFCYDLMLAQLWSRRTPSPGFLIHDSTIFDGVDERQFAIALELAAKESKRIGFQYICTLNSDTVPQSDFTEDFDLGRYVRLRLTDATEDGCLLGIRF